MKPPLHTRAEAHLRGVEGEVDAAGIADADAAFADAGKGAAHDDGFVLHLDDERLQHQPGGFAGLGALREELPERVALLAGVAAEHVGQRGFSIGPKTRHDGERRESLRLREEMVEPVFLQPLGHRGEFRPANGGGASAKGVAGDAVEALRAREFAAHVVRLRGCGTRSNFAGGSVSSCLSHATSGSGVRRAEFRHPRVHRRSHARAVGDDFAQPRRP